MGIKHTFQVKKTKASDPHTFTVDMPQSRDDEDLIIRRFGSWERMIDRANSQWTVDVATGIRKRLPDTGAAEKYAEDYCDNGKKDVFRPSIDAKQAAKEHGFSKEQLEYLKAKGFQVK